MRKYCELIPSKSQKIIWFSINEIYVGIKGHTDFSEHYHGVGPNYSLQRQDNLQDTNNLSRSSPSHGTSKPTSPSSLTRTTSDGDFYMCDRVRMGYLGIQKVNYHFF